MSNIKLTATLLLLGILVIVAFMQSEQVDKLKESNRHLELTVEVLSSHKDSLAREVARKDSIMLDFMSSLTRPGIEELFERQFIEDLRDSIREYRNRKINNYKEPFNNL